LASFEQRKFRSTPQLPVATVVSKVSLEVPGVMRVLQSLLHPDGAGFFTDGTHSSTSLTVLNTPFSSWLFRRSPSCGRCLGPPLGVFAW
jgi:hypothetical protein